MTMDTPQEQGRDGDEASRQEAYGKVKSLCTLVADPAVSKGIRKRIARRMSRRLRRAMDVDDVWQDVWPIARRRTLYMHSGEPESVKRYLECVADSVVDRHNREARTLKRGGAHRRVSDQRLLALAGNGKSPGTLTWERERKAQMWRTVNELLTKKQADVVRMVHKYGLSEREIAEQTGQSRSAVHSLYVRGIKTLRKLLGALWGGDGRSQW